MSPYSKKPKSRQHDTVKQTYARLQSLCCCTKTLQHDKVGSIQYENKFYNNLQQIFRFISNFIHLLNLFCWERLPVGFFYVQQKIAQKINQRTTFCTVLDRKSSEKSLMFLIDLCFGNSFRFSNYTKELYPYENDHIAIQLFIQNVNDDGNSALKLNHIFKNIVISKNYSTL